MGSKENKDEERISTGRIVLPVAAAVAVLACVAVALFSGGREAGERAQEKFPGIVSDFVEGEAVSIAEAESRTAAAEEMPDAQAESAGSVISPGESLVISMAQIGDTASFYPINVDGEDMEVLAVRASDGSIRTAFNTCQSCYTSGAGFYRFEGGELVCNNCGFHFSPDQVGVSSGGCNPWPIMDENKEVSEDQIAISYDFLSSSKEIFANWKTALR